MAKSVYIVKHEGLEVDLKIKGVFLNEGSARKAADKVNQELLKAGGNLFDERYTVEGWLVHK